MICGACPVKIFIFVRTCETARIFKPSPPHGSHSQLYLLEIECVLVPSIKIIFKSQSLSMGWG